MKTPIKNLFLLPVLIAGLGLIPFAQVNAQTFTTLHSFSARFDSTNSDGARPQAGLVLAGNTLYGTTPFGGGLGFGTVFAVSTNGTGFTNLHSFTGSDGAVPSAGLIVSGNTLYGTTGLGGSSSNGTIFAIHTDGTGFTNLHNFTLSFNSTNSDGAQPKGGLILSGDTLYGTTEWAGSSGKGTVFALNTNGSGFATLHSFTDGTGSELTNSDGFRPQAGLVLSGSILYGTTKYGGVWGSGAMFAVNTNGTFFTNLYNFSPLSSGPGAITNSDGAYPQSGLTLSGSNLCGTAFAGGKYGIGTVFTVNTNGTSFTTLHNFAVSDGGVPAAGLILSSNILYGTTLGGGASNSGTVFALHPDGVFFRTLHNFSGGSDGANPFGGLILYGDTVYGTTFAGGNSTNGTVFALTVDIMSPIIVISPLTNTQTVFDFAQIGGTMSEAGYLFFRIRENDASGSNHLYWDGSAWITNYDSVSVLLYSQFTGNSWLPASGVTLPSRAQTRYGDYNIQAIGADYAGNIGTNGITVTRSAADTTAPNVSLASISPGQVITNNFLPGVFGSASDPENGIASVTVYLLRATTNDFVYWTGSAWDANPASLPTIYNSTNGTWNLSGSSPSGGNLINADYQIQVSATNNEVPPLSQNTNVSFTVDYHPVFVFTAGSYFDLDPNNDNQFWTNAANWDVGLVPTADAIVVINSQFPNSTALSNLPIYRLDLNGGTLTTAGMLIRKLNLSGGNLAGGAITIATNGLFNWSGGTINTMVTVPSNIAFNISGVNSKTLGANATLNIAGNTTWTGLGGINVGAGNRLNNSGNFVVQNDAQFINYTAGLPVPLFVNTGTFTKTNSAGTTFFNSVNGGVAFNNLGSVTVQSGTLALGGGGASADDSFTVAAGSLVDFTAAAFFFSGNRTLTGLGTNRVSGAAVTFINVTNTLGGALAFELATGSVNGTNTFAGAGAFVWSGGTISATLTVPSSIACNISGVNQKYLADNAIINIAGNTTWTGLGDINVAAGSRLNNSGNFVVLNDAQFVNYTAGLPVPLFVNTGTFTKTNSPGTTFFHSVNGGVAFNNLGSVTVQSGTLALGGGGASANDSFTVAAGSLADFKAGAFFFSGNRTLTGPGTNRVSGASVTFINSTNTLGGGYTFELASGSVNGTNTFAGAGAFVWSGGTISATVTIQANIAVNISGANQKTLADNAILNTAGNATWTGAGFVAVAAGSRLNNSGNFFVQNDAQFFNYTAGLPVPVFVNSGTFTKTNSSGTTLFGFTSGGVAFNNLGSVTVQSGTLALGGGGASVNDSFTVAAGSLVDFTASTFFFSGNRTLTGLGTNRVSGASVTFINGTNTLGGAHTFELTTGSVNGTNTFAGAGTFNWSGGTISAKLNLQPAIALNLSGVNIKTLSSGGTLIVAGNTLWTGGNLDVGDASAFINNGIFNAQVGGQFFNNTAGLPVPVFVNNGVFIKSTDAAATIFRNNNGGVAFNNNGTINLQTGDLTLGGGGSGTNGIFTTASGSHIDLVFGSFNWAGNLTINGAGATRASGATLTFGGTTTTLSGTFEIANGTVGGTNTFTGAGVFNWISGNLGGIFTLQSNLTFNLAIAGDKTLQPNGVINSAANSTWSGSGTLNMGAGAAINNSGTFTVQNDMSLFNNTAGLPTPVFNNTGTFRKNTATGVTTFHPSNGGVNFNNTGTVDLQSGTILFWAGYATSPSAQLKIPISGPTANTQFGVETFNTPAIFDGTLIISLTNGFMPTNGQSFAIVNYGSRTGQFIATQFPPLPAGSQWKLNYGVSSLLAQVVASTVFQNFSLTNGGSFQFNLIGETGSACLIEASTNLVNWIPILTNTPFNGSLNFVDPQTTQFRQRFFRATIFP